MARHDPASVMEMGAGRRLILAAVLAIVIWGCVLWAV
jgi:hypothetical protein